MNRTTAVIFHALSLSPLLACSPVDDETSPSSAGAGMQTQSGGNQSSPTSSGGTSTTGGNRSVGGTSAGGSSTGGAFGGQLGAVGGATATGGAPSGGRTSTGGSATGGARTTGGASTTGGTTATGGKAAGGATTGGRTTGGTTSTGGSTAGGAATGGATTAGSSGLPRFSFFVASDAALIKLSGNANGFGGDLRFGEATGLAGADKICAAIAETSMAGSSAKQWRAFLSIAANGNEPATNAIDRVGEGPWYDRLGRVVALTKAGLAATRPTGADTAIVNDLPNEAGTPNHAPNGTQVDNHDTLTGSNATGKLASTYANTCNNWTSSAPTGKPVLGHSWIANSGQHWIQVGHTGGGCAPGRTIGAQGGPGTTVGSMGGYGGFYCFALTP